MLAVLTLGLATAKPNIMMILVDDVRENKRSLRVNAPTLRKRTRSEMGGPADAREGGESGGANEAQQASMPVVNPEGGSASPSMVSRPIYTDRPVCEKIDALCEIALAFGK